jgi:hypothetical protein
MSVDVLTNGRTDIQEYFQKSGIRESKKLSHTPLLVFQIAGDTAEVKVLDRADKLLEYPDDTTVMRQWRGEWRSDFFQFTVGQRCLARTVWSSSTNPLAYGWEHFKCSAQGGFVETFRLSAGAS